MELMSYLKRLNAFAWMSPHKRVAIEIICEEMVLQHGREHVFFRVIQMFDSFSFSKSKDGNVCISLNLDKMWERSNE